MGENTAISWADHTFNPWIGCMKISPACDGCYAEAQMGAAGRAPRAVWGGPGRGVGTRTRTKDWSKPLKWERDQARLWAEFEAADRDLYPNPPLPVFVFCASLADVFDNAVPAAWRRDLFDLIRATPHLTWLLLTKRPQNIVRMWQEIADEFSSPFWPRNAAIGCTVVNQDEAERDLPELMIAAEQLLPAFTFASMAPLLGLVDLTRLKHPWLEGSTYDVLRGTIEGISNPPVAPLRTLHWVITEGETDQGGHQARPTHPAWIQSLRDQCAAAGTPFHHKQHGEWAPICWMDAGLTEAIYHPAPRRDPEARRRCKVASTVMHADGSLHPDPADREAFRAGASAMTMFKVGKRRSGRLVDGQLHNARPEIARP